MQQYDKRIRREVFRDCAEAMFLPLMMIAIGNLLTELLYVLTASIFGDFADAVFAMDTSIGLRNVLFLALCILATAVFVPVFGMFGNFVMLRNALRHDNTIFGRFLQGDMQKVLASDLGEIQYQLEDAPNDLRIYWVNILGQMLALPIGWAYLLYRAGQISWLLTAIMVAVSLLKLAVSFFLRKRIAIGDKAEQAYNATRRAYETDITRKPYLIKLWGLKLPLLNRIDDLFRRYYKETAASYIRTKVGTEQLPLFIDTLTALILFAAGAINVAQGTISPGELAAMIAYLPVAQALLTNISEIIENYPLMINAANRVSEFYRGAEADSGDTVSRFESIVGENIRFRYSDIPVLDGAHFSIRRGDKVRITGENGSGKSTLVKILCGLLKNYDGDIRLNGSDFRSVDVTKWRQMIAYAPQTPYLFGTTVRENIVLGNDSLPRRTVDELMNGFSILPLAENQISMNAEMSGGEKQKISIIRALLHKGDILILDEPTNHLDVSSIDFLRRCLANETRTVIVITHSHALDEVVPGNIYI